MCRFWLIFQILILFTSLGYSAEEGVESNCVLAISELEMQVSALRRRADTRRYVAAYNITQRALGLRAEFVKSHETILVYSRAGRVPAGAQARVLMLHGMGWNTSTHALWREMIRVLADPSPEAEGYGRVEARSIQRALGRERILVGAEAIDMPGHGSGMDASKLAHNLDASIEYFASYIRMMKNQTPDLPIIVIGWSWAGPISIELQRRHPELIDGLVLLASTEPGEAEAVAHQRFKEFADSPHSIEGQEWPRRVMDDVLTIKRNQEGITFAASVSAAVAPLSFFDFTNTPTLFIYGAADSAVTESTRKAVKALAAREFEKMQNPFKLIILPALNDPANDWRVHEPFHGLHREDESPVSAWSRQSYFALNEFIKNVVEKRPHYTK